MIIFSSATQNWEIQSNDIIARTKYLAMKVALTNSGKAIDPTGDWISGKPNASIIAKMITILGDQIISISFILFC